MMRARFLVLTFGLALGLAGCGSGGDSGTAGDSKTTGPTALKIGGGDQGGRPLVATLSGAAEVPGPGDPDGGGEATVTLNQGQGQVCFDLAVTNIAPATRAHIHVGVAGVAGGIVVPFFEAGPTPPPTGAFPSGCVSVDPGLIQEIRQNPAGYYVNVHNAEFPAGAVRGQLAKR